VALAQFIAGVVLFLLMTVFGLRGRLGLTAGRSVV
jgi:hypothetical protein